LKKRQPFLSKGVICRLEFIELEEVKEKGAVVPYGFYLEKVIFIEFFSFCRGKKLERVIMV